MPNILPSTDRRAPHREDRAEALRQRFHPGEIADDQRGCLASIAQAKFRAGACPSLDEITALLSECAPLSPLPEF